MWSKHKDFKYPIPGLLVIFNGIPECILCKQQYYNHKMRRAA
jgi:hypothetical protein